MATDSVYIRMSPAMKQRLEELKSHGHKPTIQAMIIEAIEQYLQKIDRSQKKSSHPAS